MHLWQRLSPLPWVTMALIIGIVWQEHNYSLLYAFIIFGISFIIFCVKIRIKPVLFLLSLSTIFILGYVRHNQQQKSFYSFYKTYNHGPYDCIGTVLAIDQIPQTNFSTRITICIQQIKKHQSDKWNTLSTTFYIYTNKQFCPDVADLIKIENITFKESSNQSFNNYLIRENSAATIFISSIKYKLIDHPHYSLRKWIDHYKKGLIRRLNSKFSISTYKFFATLFLGNPAEKRQMFEIKHAFKAWGIMHYLARSGLHLILFILLLNLLLQLLPIPFILKYLLLLFILIVYSLLSWTSIPFMRALIMFIFYKTGTLLTFQINFLHLLLIVCIITLLFNPQQLFFLDFQLSFGLTGALTCFNLLND